LESGLSPGFVLRELQNVIQNVRNQFVAPPWFLFGVVVLMNALVHAGKVKVEIGLQWFFGITKKFFRQAAKIQKPPKRGFYPPSITRYVRYSATQQIACSKHT